MTWSLPIRFRLTEILFALALLAAAAGTSAPVHAAAPSVDHKRWSDFLVRYLRQSETGASQMIYGCVPMAQRADLKNYIRDMAGVNVSGLRGPERRAYWINLHNALTVDLILDHYPIRNIENLGSKSGLLQMFKSGAWDRERISVDGERLSLNDLAERAVNDPHTDPRAHYALSCGAKSCPSLRTAFTAKELDEQLDSAARRFINDHPTGVTVDGAILKVSKLYFEFSGDFRTTASDVSREGLGRDLRDHFRSYASADLADRLNDMTGIAAQDYDWRLADYPCATH